MSPSHEDVINVSVVNSRLMWKGGQKINFVRFHENDCIRWSHFGVHSSAIGLWIVFIDKSKCVVFMDDVY